MAHIHENYSAYAPSADPSWSFEDITAQGLFGSSNFQYTAEGWVITIAAPVVAPEAVIYKVEVLSEVSPVR